MANDREKEPISPDSDQSEDSFSLREQLLGETGFKPEELQEVPEEKEVEPSVEIQEQRVEQERTESKQVEKSEEAIQEGPATTVTSDVVADEDTQGSYSQTYEDIRTILDDKIEAYLQSLPDDQKQHVINEQAKVIAQLEVMVDTFVFKARDVLKMIKKWLGLIPGMNNFFRIQDAKIKTERVIEYANRKHNKQL